ncbi:MAG: M3 family oligoendopeptidase, partial [Chloroflexi bacterium]|nr:M3 family oligoendopeptidase [Chloroflexota bacterium]
MNLFSIPSSIDDINPREWETFEPYFSELKERPLLPNTTRQWLQDWSTLTELFWEAFSMIYIQKTIDTADAEKEQAFLDMINDVSPHVQVAEQQLREKLLKLDLSHMEDMALVLRDMRNDATLFREENVPLSTELAKFSNEYDKVTGAMEVDWDGEKKNLSQLTSFFQSKDRAVRKRAWLAMADLWLGKRDVLNQMYSDMLTLRQQVALNADLPDYRAYAFRERGRFDYTPADCLVFHEAIEAVVVPVAQRIYEKKCERLGLDALQPWDVQVDASDAPALVPYQEQSELVQGCLNIFQKIDPELARYFAIMAEEDLLDLDTRSGKALGGYCTALPMRKRPFIFMNGVGIHDNVQTLLHEAGHAFHAFESFSLPLVWQMNAPMEFCEVASMAMELLAAPYLTKANNAFYTPSEAARARIEHLEGIILFLPYMAVVDAFQHWVYTHPTEAKSSGTCDTVWDDLWSRFMQGVDWAHFGDARITGWHRKLHIFTVPFYYIEYGMAQVGALQVWRNSLTDQSAALNRYRDALAMGGTITLPELFEAAGAEFRFDTPMLTELV